MKKEILSTILMIFLTSCSVLQGKKLATSTVEIPHDIKQNSEEKVTLKTKEVETNLSSSEANHLKVTYIGNAGFMITTNHKKLIIDGLFRGFEGIYTLPEDIQNKLSLAQPPFDNIDLILVTHNHRDHFSSGLVASHLKNNPNAVLAALPSITGQFPNYTNRLAAFDPTPENPIQKDINGIQVEALALSHGPGQPKNIGFVITVDGFNLFFSGDIDLAYNSFEVFQSYNLPERKLDVAFIQHFYLTDIPEEQQFIKQGIAAKYLIPTHYFYTTPPFDRDTVKTYYPDAILFDGELSNWEKP